MTNDMYRRLCDKRKREQRRATRCKGSVSIHVKGLDRAREIEYTVTNSDERN